MHGKGKGNKNYLRYIASFISTLLKNNNHYPSDVKLNTNVRYYYLK